jgi:hypothetical protein
MKLSEKHLSRNGANIHEPNYLSNTSESQYLLQFGLDGYFRQRLEGLVVVSPDHDVTEAVDPTYKSPFVVGT